MNTAENHEKFKGALHVLLGPKNAPIIVKRNWTFLKEIWPLVIKSMPSEKPSVINLINSLTDAIHRRFRTITTKLVIGDSCLEAAYNWGRNAALDFDDFKGVIETGEERLRLKCEESERNYRELVSSLLDACVNGNL